MRQLLAVLFFISLISVSANGNSLVAKSWTELRSDLYQIHKASSEKPLDLLKLDDLAINFIKKWSPAVVNPKISENTKWRKEYYQYLLWGVSVAGGIHFDISERRFSACGMEGVIELLSRAEKDYFLVIGKKPEPEKSEKENWFYGVEWAIVEMLESPKIAENLLERFSIFDFKPEGPGDELFDDLGGMRVKKMIKRIVGYRQKFDDEITSGKEVDYDWYLQELGGEWMTARCVVMKMDLRLSAYNAVDATFDYIALHRQGKSTEVESELTKTFNLVFQKMIYKYYP